MLKVDDNEKLTVEEYRQMIYSQAINSVARVRAELLDVVGKSSSLKVVRERWILTAKVGILAVGKRRQLMAQ